MYLLLLIYFSATPSRKYGSRTTAGDVVASYGSADKVSWKREAENTPSITTYDPADTLDKPFKFMFEKLADKAHGKIYCINVWCSLSSVENFQA